MSDLPATRAEARALGLPRYFTGKPCKHGHVAERYVSSGVCFECGREKARKWREANRDRYREVGRKWYAANPDKQRETNRKCRAASPDRYRESARKWCAENSEKRAAALAAYRARKLNATPPWADLEAIKAIYAECARITAETGIEHHVDHIVPLRGRTVCGLHAPCNLRVIPATDNLAKGNKMV